MPIMNQPFIEARDSAGNAVPNAELRAYITGTTTATPIYSDSALTTPHSVPVLSGADGRFPAVFYSTSVSTRIIIKSSNGDTLADEDPVNEGSTTVPDGSVTSSKLASSAVTESKIADQAVSNAKMAAMPTNTVKGNDSSIAAVPQDLTGSEVLLSVIGPLLTGAVISLGYSAADSTHWLVCDGRAVSRTTYARLFAKIGTTWGAGDGSTTFTLPNMRNYFQRGGDRDAAAAYGHEVGTYQDDAMQTYTAKGGKVFDGTFSGGFSKGTGSGVFSAAGAQAFELDFDLASTSARTAVETRPRNAAFDFVIFI